MEKMKPSVEELVTRQKICKEEYCINCSVYDVKKKMFERNDSRSNELCNLFWTDFSGKCYSYKKRAN